ncbi:MAG TPA: hypothetical protein VMX17_07795 [Candidatus Glassbacteria bacterium]|nr:hypothetical protein [Candidatus Glassbacteria bacterium]
MNTNPIPVKGRSVGATTMTTETTEITEEPVVVQEEKPDPKAIKAKAELKAETKAKKRAHKVIVKQRKLDRHVKKYNRLKREHRF